MRADDKNGTAGRHATAFAAYFLCSCITFGLALKGPLTYVVGAGHLHVWEELWHFWWTARALATGISPFVSEMLGFPGEMNVFYDMSSISLPFASLPLQLLFGVVGAYNVTALLALTAAAFGAYLVCYRVCGSSVPAFLGGIVFGFSPFLQTELTNGMMENLFAFAFLPYLLLCLLRMNERTTWTDGLAAGLIMGCATLSSWYFAAVSAFMIALVLLPALAGAAGDTRRRLLFAYAVLAGTFVLLTVVPATALMRGPGLQRAVPWRDCVRGQLMQKSCIDVLRFFTCVRDQPGGDLQLLPFGVYMGKITVFTIALALLAPVRSWRWWKGGFVLFALLTLGPYLNIGGRVDWWGLRLPLLNRLFLLVPGFGRMFALHNYRFVSCAMLFGAILTSLVAARIPGSANGSSKGRTAVLIFLCWLIVVDFGNSQWRSHAVFLPTADTTIPAVYAVLDGEPDGALFNIPVSSGAHRRPEIRGIQMYHQSRHLRPIPCDPIYQLEPPQNETSVARAARNMVLDREWELDDAALGKDLIFLYSQGFRFIAVHRRFLSAHDDNRIRPLLQKQLGEPLAEGEGIEIYRLVPPTAAERGMVGTGPVGA